MCGKTAKAETVVHPAGQDWANADPTFTYFQRHSDGNNALEPGKGYTDPDDPPGDFELPYADSGDARRASISKALEIGIGKGMLSPPDDRLSAPPRASLADRVGLVLGMAARRLCDRHVASCAILVATGVFVALAGLFALIGG